MLNVTEVSFNGAKGDSAALYQYDYGQILTFPDLILPEAYEVHFARQSDAQTITMIGTADGVAVPDEMLLSAGHIKVYIYLHEGETDGETEYKAIIPVIARPEPSHEEPTPVQQSEIEQVIAALNGAVEDAEAAAEEAEGFAEAAKETAESIPELAPVATSGDYDDLTNKPEIPTDVVKYSVQSLTANQRRQAVTNITAVSYDVQSLSTIQRNTARNNIKAISADELNEAIIASLITDTASGDPCSIPDGANAPVVDCTVQIVPKQSGSGTPSPDNVRPISGWAEMTMRRTGMNVFDLASAFDDLGVTYTVDSDGWFTVENIGSPNLYSNHMPMPYTVTNGSVVMELHSDTTATNFRARVYSGSTAVAQGTKIENKTFDNIGFDWGNIGKVKFKLMVVNSKTVGDVCYPYEEQEYTKSWTPTVYGGSLDLTTGVLTVTDGYIASYNGETLPSTWISDRDVYAVGTTPTTGAEVVYKLANPTTIQLTPTEVSTILGSNTFSADTGAVTVEYKADTELWVEGHVPSKTSQLTNDSGFITASNAPVRSVNGKTGVVVIGNATTSAAGLMSATDKSRLDDLYADYSSAMTALGV